MKYATDGEIFTFYYLSTKHQYTVLRILCILTLLYKLYNTFYETNDLILYIPRL